jgi:hypothetical protein
MVMTRVTFGVLAVLAGLSGCASPAKYVSKDSQTASGVVAIPANTDTWPTYNRRAALALIEKHVGPNFEIIEEREVATGQRTTNNQQVNGNQAFGETTTQDVTEWRIAYRKKSGPPTGITPVGGMQPVRLPGGAGAVQPAGGLVPSMAPGAGVIPAGGVPRQ